MNTTQLLKALHKEVQVVSDLARLPRLSPEDKRYWEGRLAGIDHALGLAYQVDGAVPVFEDTNQLTFEQREGLGWFRTPEPERTYYGPNLTELAGEPFYAYDGTLK